ncbi:MAG: hypothetical protein ABIQ04_03200 [Candidatus Saccharimonadales bacterium]
MTFHLLKSISFRPIDPIDNGLREEIIAEQQEPDAITFEEGLDEGQSQAFWENVEEDIHKDPEWFTFDNEE